MIKNKLYPLVEKYINTFLYGFTKEQLDVGIMKGIIALENLNLRPDVINAALDKKNKPIWLKAGSISKISIGCSLMNFIGEKPLDVLIDGVDVIVSPSYRWIISNMTSFVEEGKDHIHERYDPNENNSTDIFTRKVSVFDNSIFNKKLLLEIFKDKSKLSYTINKMFNYFFSFFYMKNYLVNLTVKNIHIRFEDDQLINYIGDIALGFKVNSIIINLSAEGNMKKNFFQLNKFDFYWESKPKLLIASSLLNQTTKVELGDEYYAMLKRLNFGKFAYVPETKFIIENFNCKANFGTQALTSGNMDLFGKRENKYKFYIQYSSSELNLNLFPDLLTIMNSFQKFINEFSIIEQIQEFKPMKKPYNKTKPEVAKMLSVISKENETSKLKKDFLYKKKMLVRDWLYYFYWCKQCNTSLHGKTLNPLRGEFSRFYSLYFEGWEKKKVQGEEEKDKKENKNPNPDNVDISFVGQFLIKSINVYLHHTLSQNKGDKKDWACFNMNGFEIKINVNKDQFDFGVNVNNCGFGPNQLIKGERVVIGGGNRRYNGNSGNNIEMLMMLQQRQFAFMKGGMNMNMNMMNQHKQREGNQMRINPLIEERMKVLNDALNKTGTNNSVNSVNSNPNAVRAGGNRNASTTHTQSTYNINNNNNNKLNNNRNTFINKILIQHPHHNQRSITTKDKHSNVSQAILEYNTKKLLSNPMDNSNPFSNTPSSLSLASNTSSKQQQQQKIPLNLFEIYNNNNKPCIQISYTKTNNDTKSDVLQINLGIIRLNLFAEYVSSCLSIVSEFKAKMNKPQVKTTNNPLSQGVKLQKQLSHMKQYIYNYLINLPEHKKTIYIQEYIDYLKEENDKSKAIAAKEGSFEVNYFMSMFSKGVEVKFDYESFECVYYLNKSLQENKILGKAYVPQIGLDLKLTMSRIYIKFFDFEFEINDLENSKLLMTTLMKIMEEKLKTTKIFIEPCLKELKLEAERTEKEKEKEKTFVELGNERFQGDGKKYNLNMIKEKVGEKDHRGITATLQGNDDSDDDNL